MWLLHSSHFPESAELGAASGARVPLSSIYQRHHHRQRSHHNAGWRQTDWCWSTEWYISPPRSPAGRGKAAELRLPPPPYYVLPALRGVNNNYRSCSKNKPADRHNNLISKRLILEHSNSNNSSQLFAARADNCELDRRETAEESSGLCVCVTRLVTIVVTHGAGEIDGVVIKETYRGVEREEPSTFWEKVRGRVANETYLEQIEELEANIELNGCVINVEVK